MKYNRFILIVLNVIMFLNASVATARPTKLFATTVLAGLASLIYYDRTLTFKGAYKDAQHQIPLIKENLSFFKRAKDRLESAQGRPNATGIKFIDEFIQDSQEKLSRHQRVLEQHDNRKKEWQHYLNQQKRALNQFFF